MQLKLL